MATIQQEVPPALESFHDHVRHVWLQWDLFENLFMKDDVRSSELFAHIGVLVHYLRLAIANDLIIGIARLTDPAETCGRKNLSVAYAARKLVGPGLSPKYGRQLKAVIRAIDDRARIVREHRNKLIGHLDLDVAQGLSPIARLELRRVKRAAGALRRFAELLFSSHGICRGMTSGEMQRQTAMLEIAFADFNSRWESDSKGISSAIAAVLRRRR